MNLLIGILCEDGVVLASADMGKGAGLDPVAESQAITFVVEGDLILAGAGPVGLGQRFADVVRAFRSDSRFPNWNGAGVARLVCAEVVDDFASTRADLAQFDALLAFAACDGFQLCRFGPRDLQPELKTAGNRFASTGSGRVLAAPFLRFLEGALFADSPPTLDEGVFAALWTLDYAFGFDQGPIPQSVRIAVLAQESPGLPPAARRLSAEELSRHLAAVRAAERHVAGYRSSVPKTRGHW